MLLTELYQNAKAQMGTAIEHLEKSLVKIRVGRASPQMLEHVSVDYYGALTPLDQVANVSTLDANTLLIQPWEKRMIGSIEKAIFSANIGLTPQNDGIQIRISVPPLTEERRKELMKRCSAEGEHVKVSIRTMRREAIDMLKNKESFPNLSEDMTKEAEAEVQKITNGHISRVDVSITAKEKEIMTV